MKGEGGTEGGVDLPKFRGRLLILFTRLPRTIRG